MFSTWYLLLATHYFTGVTTSFINLPEIDRELGVLNAATAEMSWNSAIGSKESAKSNYKNINLFRSIWKKKTCLKLNKFIPLNYLDKRSIQLLCRGSVYTPGELLGLSEIQSKLRYIYQNGAICTVEKCFKMEPDLEQILKTEKDPNELSNIWEAWRDSVGPNSKRLFSQLVKILNRGAQRNGYRDIGEVWKEELEIENVEKKMVEILQNVMPLYKTLHAVVRYRLREFYGPKIFPKKSGIPGHLLGNMWGQDWAEVFDIIYKGKKPNTLTEELRKRYSVKDLIQLVENFYKSIGFPPMPAKFWENSKFQNSDGLCHGTAVNMFKANDYRIILCANVTEEDLRIIFHEFGHIKFFMAYENQRAVFKNGNSAIQETIGDAVYLSSYTAAQRKRMGIETKTETDSDLQYLLKIGLSLIPQLPFSFIMDKWRWSVFNLEILPKNYNYAWWELVTKYQGITPPVPRTDQDFDPAAKYHINDNTPYARYFIATFLQVQFFEAMCKGAVYGDSYTEKALPFPLSQCDIYGSPNSTETLRKMMGLGNAVDFTTAVKIVTNSTFSVKPFLDFFQPLKEWLEKEITTHDIPVGWQ